MLFRHAPKEKDKEKEPKEKEKKSGASAAMANLNPLAFGKGVMKNVGAGMGIGGGASETRMEPRLVKWKGGKLDVIRPEDQQNVLSVRLADCSVHEEVPDFSEKKDKRKPLTREDKAAIPLRFDVTIMSETYSFQVS